VRRAPVWMQRSGLEWVFRLLQEPKRLFRRYAQDVFIFSSGFASQWWSLQKLRTHPGSPAEVLQPSSANNGADTSHFKLPARLDYPALVTGALPIQEILNRGLTCILDSSAVDFIDSSGIGGLVGLHKKLRSIGCELIVFRPAKAIRQALKLMRLQDFFQVCESERELQSWLERVREGEPALRQSHDGSFAWKGEVTAATANRVREETLAFLDRSNFHHTLTINMLDVRFIDSSGLGLMLKLKKEASHRGLTLRFSGFQPAVRNVLRLAHLEKFFESDADPRLRVNQTLTPVPA
jgi:N-acetylglucosaminyldiphosphoundecaprenol N-acetyl-beta-D-mannosaminyltransferase